MKTSVARGRRSGESNAKDLIRDAARRRFLADGYHDATMRSIAADAGVDVALVAYYFGSKRGLFTAAMSLKINPAELVHAALQAELHTLPTRMLRDMLTAWDDPSNRAPLLETMTAATSDPQLRQLAAEAVEREIVIPIAERIGGNDANRRAAAFCAQMSGILFSRYLLRIEPIASMAVDDIINALTPSLTATLWPTAHPAPTPAGRDRQYKRPPTA